MLIVWITRYDFYVYFLDGISQFTELLHHHLAAND